MVRDVIRSWLRLAPLLLACALAACGGGARLASRPAQDYAQPGPADDPWGPYIRQAAARFDVPERWIREVMRQESGGHQYLRGRLTTSDAGAMGLMQIMPATYEELRARHGLGDNPYDPHDNIFAGTAYIRELYDKYGSPGFLAAYNAGPQRLEDYNAGRSGLPNETVTYLAAVAPRLGTDRPTSGPLAVYAQGYGGAAPARPRDCADLASDPGHPCPTEAPVEVAAAYVSPAPQAAPVRSVFAPSGCWHDPNRAYDPTAACETPPAAPVQMANSAPAAVPRPANCWHDPDRAYDPTAPCEAPRAPAVLVQPAASAPVEVAEAPASGTRAGSVLWRDLLRPNPPPAPRPPSPSRFAFIPTASASEIRPAPGDARWGVQVGAFASPALARSVAESARGLALPLAASRTLIGLTSPFGGHVLYRARLTGLTASQAIAACRALAARETACLTVPPGG